MARAFKKPPETILRKHHRYSSALTDKWLNGQIWELEEGSDYPDMNSLRVKVCRMATKHGLVGTVRKHPKEGKAYVQFAKNADALKI